MLLVGHVVLVRSVAREHVHQAGPLHLRFPMAWVSHGCGGAETGFVRVSAEGPAASLPCIARAHVLRHLQGTMAGTTGGTRSDASRLLVVWTRKGTAYDDAHRLEGLGHVR